MNARSWVTGKARRPRAVQAIAFQHYPELASLCWNRHGETIAPEDAYSLYVEQWEFVDKTHLSAAERELIEELNTRHGGMLRL